MFRKKVPKKGAAVQVKQSALRKLRSSAEEAYPLMTKEQLDSVLPASATIKQQKLTGHNVVYYHDGMPVFFTVHPKGGSEELLPTLYTLHIAPQILPVVEVAPGLQAKICTKQAKLFMPGVVMCKPPSPRQSWVTYNFGKFRKGDKVLLHEQGALFPFALGEWLLDTRDLELKGVVGESIGVVHNIDDALWLEGHASIPQDLPLAATNPLQYLREHKKLRASARLKDVSKRLRTIPQLKVQQAKGGGLDDAQLEEIAREAGLRTELRCLESLLARFKDEGGEEDEGAAGEKSDEEAEDEEQQGSVSGSGQQEEEEAAKGAEQAFQSAGEGGSDDDTPRSTTAATAADAQQGEREQQQAGKDKREQQAETGTRGAEKQQQQQQQQGSADEVARLALLVAIKTSLTRDALPLLASTAMAQHIKPAASQLPERAVNLKATTYKKMKPFLQAMQAEGVLTLSEAVAGKVMIESIDYIHPALMFDVRDVIVPADEDSSSTGVAMVESDARRRQQQAAKSKRPPKGGKVRQHQKILLQTKKVKGRLHVLASRFDLLGFEVDSETLSRLKQLVSAAVEVGPILGRPKQLQLTFHCKLRSRAVDAMKKVWGLEDRHFQIK